MAHEQPGLRKANFLNDPVLKEKLQELRQTDNAANLYYLARTYLLLGAVIGGYLWLSSLRASADLPFWWDLPALGLAIVAVGALQHQLTGLAHEAAHHILFRNRYFNELASDWLCMFPLFSSTHHYRLQHLAHHQFVNDPDRDPDVSQLQTSGHWLRFPLAPGQFRRTLLKQLWFPNLVKYMRVRATYNAVPSDKNPYLPKGYFPSRIPVRVGLAYILGLIGLLTTLVWHGDPVLLALLPAAIWAGIVTFYLLIPARLYHQSRVHSVISARWMTVGRITHLTAVFSAMAWIAQATGHSAALLYFLLWVVPIFSSFSFLMIQRQIVQHGNGGRGWVTNTRVFLVRWLIRFGVFPIGQDYHLPHHLFATVPHYRLRELHALLLNYEAYREQAVVVEGYFHPPRLPTERPTVVEVLGPAYAPRDSADVYIDNTVLDAEAVENRAAILSEVEAETGQRASK
jgi:fatty acid desaturase